MTRTITKTALAGFMATLMMSGAALAQVASVEATVDLNLRSGPGPQYDTIGLIGVGDTVTLNGCLRDSKWCEVDHEGNVGWAYSDYLTGEMSGSVIVLAERQAELPVVEFEDDDEGAVAAGAVGGAIVGALVGGPIGAVMGGAAGAAAGDLANPPEEVQTYVRDRDLDTVYLDGEVVIGAEVPEVVELAEIPEYEDYRYARINGQVVLINPGTRRIVYVFRD